MTMHNADTAAVTAWADAEVQASQSEGAKTRAHRNADRDAAIGRARRGAGNRPRPGLLARLLGRRTRP